MGLKLLDLDHPWKTILLGPHDVYNLFLIPVSNHFSPQLHFSSVFILSFKSEHKMWLFIFTLCKHHLIVWPGVQFWGRWGIIYFFIKFNVTASIWKEKAAILWEYNLEWHYFTKHTELGTSCSALECICNVEKHKQTKTSVQAVPPRREQSGQWPPRNWV